MILKQKFHAGVYSFCFPGLGQLFNSRPFVSLSFFLGFALIEWYYQYIFLLPLFALVSAMEAFINFKEGRSKASRSKEYLYTTVAVLNFTFWMLLLAPSVIPM